MSAKMNWDRVRKESQSRRSGSDWIGSDAMGPLPGLKMEKPQKNKAAKKIRPSGWSRAPKNASGKVIAPAGARLEKSKIIDKTKLQAGASSSRNPFAECVKNAGKLPPVGKFLSSLLNEVGISHGISIEDRQGARKLIRALQDSLADASTQKPIVNDKRTLPCQLGLRKIIEMRSDVFIRASNRVASVAVEAVAKNLDLQAFRFQCSPSTKDWELKGHTDDAGDYHPTLFRKAIKTGGIFFIEHLERAPNLIQDWIKSCLEGDTLGESKSVKRHQDFVLVLTSSLGIRQLWFGKSDTAFIDRFLYVELA